jgi:hypothetical protein
LPLPAPPAALPAAARPIKPALTPRLRLSLRGSERWNYPPDGGDPIPVLATDWHPPPLDAVELAAARVAITTLERGLAPADPDWITVRVMAADLHDYVPDLDETVQAMIAADKEKALAPFPAWAIEDALAERLAAGGRVTIAVWVAGCIRKTASLRAELGALRRLADPREQERARRRQAEREAEDKREAEREEWNRQNPGLRPFQDALRRVAASAQAERDDAQGS